MAHRDTVEEGTRSLEVLVEMACVVGIAWDVAVAYSAEAYHNQDAGDILGVVLDVPVEVVGLDATEEDVAIEVVAHVIEVVVHVTGEVVGHAIQMDFQVVAAFQVDLECFVADFHLEPVVHLAEASNPNADLAADASVPCAASNHVYQNVHVSFRVHPVSLAA